MEAAYKAQSFMRIHKWVLTCKPEIIIQDLIIVKPWSKSKSNPLSQQTIKVPKKRKEEVFGPRADTKIKFRL